MILYMNKFYRDLQFGQKYEKLLTEIIDNQGFEFCDGKAYDIKMIVNGKEKFYEVKVDRLGYRTKNICIEYESRGWASGISTTECDKYAYFVLFPDKTFDLYVIPISRLWKMIKREQYKRKINCGDELTSKAYIFDRQLFNKYLKVTHTNEMLCDAS
jgi:hypothetical protein